MSLTLWEQAEAILYSELKRQAEYTRLVELLEGDPKPVWDTAYRLFEDGWEGTVPDLVLAARLLAGDS